MLRDPTGSDKGSTSEACDICRQLGSFRNTGRSPGYVGRGETFTARKTAAKARFLLPEKEVARWHLEDFPKKEDRMIVKIVRTV